MNCRYAEKVSIEEIETLDVQEITSVVKILAKNTQLSCFSSDLTRSGPFVLDSKVRVLLSLMTTQYTIGKDSEKEKTIQSYRTTHTPNHCILAGTLVDLVPITTAGFFTDDNRFSIRENPYYIYGIVDCGFFIAVEIPRKDNPHIGDSLKAEGRLDIQIARDRKRISIDKTMIDCCIDDYSFTYPVPNLHNFSINPAKDNDANNAYYSAKGSSAQNIILFLSPHGLKKSIGKMKYIEPVRNNFSKIGGRIQEFIPILPEFNIFQSHSRPSNSPKQYIVLDCGIPLIIEVIDPFPEKHGDFLEGIGEILVRTTPAIRKPV